MRRDLDSTFERLRGDQPEEDEAEVETEEERQSFYFGESQAHITERQDHTPSDLKHVPAWDDDYEPDPALFEQIVACICADQPVVLVGPKGSGKSSAVLALAALVRQPLIRVNMTGQTRVRDIIGFKTLDYEYDEDGEAFQVINWIDGVVPFAHRSDYWLLIDEIDATPPPVMFAMQAVLEPARRLVILENAGEVLLPHSDHPGLPDEPEKRRFRIIGTANTLGFGDDTGLYAGTNLINAATMDRMNVIHVDYPSKETETRIVMSRTRLSETVVGNMVKLAGLVREAVKIDECGVTISTRQLVKWGEMITSMWDKSPESFRWPSTATGRSYHIFKLAYRMTVGNKLPDEDKTFYAGVIQREWKLGV